MNDYLWPEVYPTDENLPGQEGYLPWTFECASEDCNWITAHKNQEAAWNEKQRHRDNTCPYQGGINMPAGRGILGKYWGELDKLTKYLIESKNELRAAGSPEDVKFWEVKGKATGIAYCISELSRPYFNDENDDPSILKVSQWARKRYQMDRGEIEVMDTPGVGGYEPHVPPRRDLAPAPKKRVASPKSDPKTGQFVALTDEQMDILKRAMGKVPDAALAKLVKISPEQLAHVKTQLEGAAK